MRPIKLLRATWWGPPTLGLSIAATLVALWRLAALGWGAALPAPQPHAAMNAVPPQALVVAGLVLVGLLAVILWLLQVAAARADALIRSNAELQKLNAELDTRVRERTDTLAYSRSMATLALREAELARNHAEQTAAELAEETQLLWGLTDNAPDLICIKDAHHRYLFNNPAHLSLIGVASQEQASGKTDSDFLRPAIAGRYRANDELALDKGEPLLNLEEPAIDPSGSVRWLATSRIPLRDSDGRVVRLLSIGRDVTDLREARERLRHTNTELTRRNLEMEQFLHGLSHDLKSPVVTITGLLGLMDDDLTHGRYEQVAVSKGHMDRAAGRLRRALEQLLQLSHINEVRYWPQEIDMDALLVQVARAAEPQLSELGATLEIQPDLPSIIADRDAVTEALDRLIENALVHARPGEPTHIQIGARLADGEVCFFVRDNGPGVEPRHYQKIFQLFQKLRPGSDRLGVGLSFVSRVMEVHGGRAWVESEVGQGAAFWLAFPLAVVDTMECSVA